VAGPRSGFYVEDDGPGIPADERDRVLDPGYMSAAAGIGFGLAIVDRIAAAHGWTVRVAESADGGVRFEFAGIERSESGWGPRRPIGTGGRVHLPEAPLLGRSRFKFARTQQEV